MPDAGSRLAVGVLPTDVHTIADLSNLPAILHTRSYTEDDIQATAHGNFLRATEARRRAAESGQQELAAAIDRELASIK